MYAMVLGAAAGGGFPQWNDGSAASVRARSGDPLAKVRTQCSIAVSADGVNWFLVNASPDLPQQIACSKKLHPRGPGRSSPIAGVLLAGGEVDAIAGLLTLRERQAFIIMATSAVLDILKSNPIFNVLAPDRVTRMALAVDREFSMPLPDGGASGLHCTLFAVPGKAPLYLEDEAGTSDADTTVGVRLRHGDSDLMFVPGCAAITADLRARLRGADCVLFDGTLWRDDEMIVAGLGTKTGRRMGHVSVSGPDGVIAALADLDIRRKVFIHINNTNPMLLEDSPEHAAAVAAGWQIAYDGMQVFG